MPKDEEYTADELDGLSEEERLAITGDDEDAADDDGEGVGDDDAGDDIDQDDDLEADDNQDNYDDGAEKQDEVVDELPVPKDKPEPPAQMKLPDDLSDSFKDRLKALTAKFDDGEIELADLLDGRDRINRDIYNAEVQVAEQNKAATVWKTAQDEFFASNDHYMKDEKRYASLDVCVKAVAASADNLSLPEILAKAKVMEEAMNGVVKVVAVKEKGPKSLRPSAPNLGDLPASAANDTASSGEFAHMDKLTGMEYEAALSAMSEAKRDRYMQG